MQSSSTEQVSIGRLADYYSNANKDNKLYVGIEWERSGVYRDSLEPVPYYGDKGYLATYKLLSKESGWKITEREGDVVKELSRGSSRITIEGDGRPELSGSPRVTIHALAREFRLHAHDIQEMGNVLGIQWLALGYQPFHPNADIPLTNVRRYHMLIDTIQGGETESELKRYNGLTINLSYKGEENALAKIRTAFRILPIVSAMFASSPLYEGVLSEYLCVRRRGVCTVAPNRTDMPPDILSEDCTLVHFIEHAADKPVLFIVNHDAPEEITDCKMTFREWMQNGYHGRYPTLYDFDQHVKTIWSDIRLRSGYIEYRVPDSVPINFALSAAAFLKGLFMSSESWDMIQTLTRDWTYEDVVDIEKRSWKTGLQTDAKGKKLLWYAHELITLANDQLHQFARYDATDTDESVYLTPLKEQLFIKEKSLAEEIAGLWNGDWNKNPQQLLLWLEKHHAQAFT